MGIKMEIEVMTSIYDQNDKISDEINKNLTDKNIFAVNVMGAPGVGKTSTLIRLISRLSDFSKKCAVIEGDIESDIDAKTLKNLGVKTYQINTGGACHLDSPLIKKAISDMNLEEDILFIENIGNLVCPAEFMIGEHIKMLISNVTEGSDKPYKYPLAFEKADVIVLNKCDLLAYVDFDNDMFMKGVRALNKNAPVFLVSAKTNEGFDELAAWTEKKSSLKN